LDSTNGGNHPPVYVQAASTWCCHDGGDGMDFLPAWLNPIDIIIVFALLGGVALGFIRGLIRMALNLLVLYAATVLAMALYIPFGRFIGTIFGLPEAVNEAIAFLLILLATTIAINFVLHRTYKDTELPGIRQIDQLGGMVIGFFLTCIWIGLGIAVLSFLLDSLDTGTSVLRTNLIYFLRTSVLMPIFNAFLPIAFATLKPWMPKGQLPEIFGLKLF
jgi:uncharacterized membrane protein required for colicin V production